MKKTLSVLLVALSLTAGTGVLLAMPAGATQLRVGCYGDYCSGQDPTATNCAADAYTVASAGVYGTNGTAYVELRWSPTCKTNWARTNLITNQVKAVQSTGYTQGYSSNNGSFSWSKMIYSPTLCVKGIIWGAWGATETWCV